MTDDAGLVDTGPRKPKRGILSLKISEGTARRSAMHKIGLFIAAHTRIFPSHGQLLVQVIGRADADDKEIPMEEAIVAVENFADFMAKAAGPLFVSVCKEWHDLTGFDPSERGSGFGEWDLGSYIPREDAMLAIAAVHVKFEAAFDSGLLRWYLSGLSGEDDE